MEFGKAVNLPALMWAMVVIIGAGTASQAQTTQPTVTRKPIRFQRPAPPGAPPGEKTAVARGDDDDNLPQPVLFAEQAAPGVTISDKPALYFYMPRGTKNKLVVTL